MNNKRFTINDTLVLKGIAIFVMLYHHSYPNNPGFSLNMIQNLEGNIDFNMILAGACKICVPLFTILSGYGIAESYKENQHRDIKKTLLFILSKLFRLYSAYWICMLFIFFSFFSKSVDLSSYYGNGFLFIINIIFDFFGVAYLTKTPSIITTGWYMSAIIVYYVFFPILYILCKKLKYFCLLIFYIPWIVYLYANNIEMHTDWWLFYLFSFVLGITLSQQNFLNRIMQYENYIAKIIISISLFVVVFIIRVYITLPIDPFLSLSIIIIYICLFSNSKIFCNIFRFFGQNSTNMWLIHGYYVVYYYNYFNYRNIQLKFISLFFLSLSTSYLINTIKEASNYNKFVNTIKIKIMQH